MLRTNEVSRISWQEVDELRPADRVAFLPIGSLEQNGLQNPLSVDAIVARHFANGVSAAVGGMVYPTIPYGISQAFKGYAGTVWLRPETLDALVRDVVASIRGHGFRSLIVVNGHGPNAPVIEQALRALGTDESFRTALVWPGQVAGRLASVSELFDPSERGHGAEPTTSMMLALCPEDVRMDLAQEDHPGPAYGLEVINSFSATFEGMPVGLFSEMHRVNPTGITGDPSRANAERGRQILDQLIDWGVSFVSEFHSAESPQ